MLHAWTLVISIRDAIYLQILVSFGLLKTECLYFRVAQEVIKKLLYLVGSLE